MLKPIDEIINEASYQNNSNTVFSNVLSIGNINSNLITGIKDIVKDILSQYAVVKFRLIPIEFTEDDVNLVLLTGIAMDLLSRNVEINELNVNLSNEWLKRGEEKTQDYDDTKTDRFIVDNKTTKTGYKSNEISTESNNMSENSPIDADITSINTPDRKGKDIFSSNGREDINYTDDIDKDETHTITSELTDSIKTISPEMYEQYYKMLKETSIMRIIYNSINKFIYEFNMVW